MKQLRILAPAKINLSLQILRKRPDGYHDLYSVFHKLKLSDELLIERTVREGCVIQCSDRVTPRDSSNLIYKGYSALKNRCAFRGGIKVKLKKRIPVAAGMGGGSSDAAATLKAVKRLFRLPISESSLKRIGKSLGADIPFFLQPSKSAVVRGIGEVIRPLKNHPSFYYLIITFPKGLSTPLVYKGLGLTPQKQGARIFRFFDRKLGLEQLRKVLNNDLMPVSFRLYPLVKRVFDTLNRDGFAVSQTGSGPTLFVAHNNRNALVKLQNNLKKRFHLNMHITESN